VQRKLAPRLVADGPVATRRGSAHERVASVISLDERAARVIARASSVIARATSPRIENELESMSNFARDRGRDRAEIACEIRFGKKKRLAIA
jgi:hypothetical protein